MAVAVAAEGTPAALAGSLIAKGMVEMPQAATISTAALAMGAAMVAADPVNGCPPADARASRLARRSLGAAALARANLANLVARLCLPSALAAGFAPTLTPDDATRSPPKSNWDWPCPSLRKTVAARSAGRRLPVMPTTATLVGCGLRRHGNRARVRQATLPVARSRQLPRTAGTSPPSDAGRAGWHARPTGAAAIRPLTRPVGAFG